ncbi:MAG: NAD(P)/FAD-dependent oxidoreductase [Candidatus Thorarchaeota archaeon]|nr:MAG: NAD(P)/FAD-dependent oxidoreductase [Candidatus Thorarchaeota archaeon]
MPSIDYDVIIAGGGPAGLITSRRVAEDGHNVAVLEEHPEIGRPDHCAGLISTSGLRSLKLRPPKDVVQNHVSAARIFAPSGQSILIERGKREAFVLDRSRFDSWLAEKAADAGAEILTKNKVLDVDCAKQKPCTVTLKTGEGREIKRSQVVVDAEGSRCQLSRLVGLPTVPRRNKYPAYQFEMSGVDIADDVVEMYYGRHVAPGFFAWIIPLGDGRARVGLAAKDLAKMRLEASIRQHPVMSKRLEHAYIERGFGGIVLVGTPIKRTVSGRFLVVGDAAGMVKPTTGGGVIMGGAAARIAGRVVSRTLLDGRQIEEGLRLYESNWRALLMRELRAMHLAQRMISSLSDQGLNILIRDAENFDLVDIVRKEGDMDMQRKVIFRLLANPYTILAGLRAIRYFNPLL